MPRKTSSFGWLGFFRTHKFALIEAGSRWNKALCWLRYVQPTFMRMINVSISGLWQPTDAILRACVDEQWQNVCGDA